MTPRLGLVLLALGGCTLIDQNTFNPHAGDAPVIPPAPKVAVAPVQVGPPPLLVIEPGAAEYGEALRRAVAAARARKTGVLFDVVEMVLPATVTAGNIGAEAASIARRIVDQGVPARNVRLAARPEEGVRPGQVRVFVR